MSFVPKALLLKPRIVPSVVYSASLPSLHCAMKWHRHAGRNTGGGGDDRWFHPAILCLPPLTPIERRTFDYSGLGAALALVDEAMSNIQRTLAEPRSGLNR
jgi:hypothetical protein